MAPAPGPATQVAQLELPPQSGFPEAILSPVGLAGSPRTDDADRGSVLLATAGAAPTRGLRSEPRADVEQRRRCSDLEGSEADEDTFRDNGSGRPRAVQELPDLSDRIEQMGWGPEYAAFRERYLAWRKGEARGARGDLLNDRRPQQDAHGFGFWYPNVEEWKWRRTISYWIAVTFFEGSVFFMVSSFLYNCKEQLGPYFYALTTGGYIAGKVMYLICTYLMCIETVNLSADGHVAVAQCSTDGASSGEASGSSSSEETDGGNGGSGPPKPQRFLLWPFHFRQAVNNLAKVGIGPWPYYASVLYLIGVLIFGFGLGMELSHALPHEAEEQVLLWSFFVGSVAFLLGGLAECIENETFTSLQITKGWLGALFNTLGGLAFLVGAICGWIDTYWSNICYGIGSLLFVVGSSVMIIMWKDEQFGLTFLAVLNKLGGPTGRPMIARGQQDDPSEAHFSPCGVIFIHVYCVLGAVSVYNANSELALAWARKLHDWRGFQLSLNELLPFLFATMSLALTSAVVRMPKLAPYRQLFLIVRVLALVMLANSGSTFVEFLLRLIKVHAGKP